MFGNWLDRRSSGSVLYRFSSIYFNLIYELIHSASVTPPAALSPRPFSRHDLLKASTPSLSLCPFVPYCPPSPSQRHRSPAAATLFIPPPYPLLGIPAPPPPLWHCANALSLIVIRAFLSRRCCLDSSLSLAGQCSRVASSALRETGLFRSHCQRRFAI